MGAKKKKSAEILSNIGLVVLWPSWWFRKFSRVTVWLIFFFFFFLSILRQLFLVSLDQISRTKTSVHIPEKSDRFKSSDF